MFDMRGCDSTNLGILDRLLPEIRRLVFQMYFDDRNMELDYPLICTKAGRRGGRKKGQWRKCYPTDLLQVSKAIYHEAKAVEALTEVKLSFGDRIDETKCLDNVPPKAVRNVTTVIEITCVESETIQGLDFRLYPQLRVLSLAGCVILYPWLTLSTGNVDDLVKGRLDHHLLQHVQHATETRTHLHDASRRTPCVPIPGPDPVRCPSGFRFIIKHTVRVKFSQRHHDVDVVSCPSTVASPLSTIAELTLIRIWVLKSTTASGHCLRSVSMGVGSNFQ